MLVVQLCQGPATQPRRDAAHKVAHRHNHFEHTLPNTPGHMPDQQAKQSSHCHPPHHDGPHHSHPNASKYCPVNETLSCECPQMSVNQSATQAPQFRTQNTDRHKVICIKEIIPHNPQQKKLQLLLLLLIQNKSQPP